MLQEGLWSHVQVERNGQNMLLLSFEPLSHSKASGTTFFKLKL
jgi:hypothetical protein